MQQSLKDMRTTPNECILLQACEYIAFCKVPKSTRVIRLLSDLSTFRSNTTIEHHKDQRTTKHRNSRDDSAMLKAAQALRKILKHGNVTTTGIPDQPPAERTKITLPAKWKLDIGNNRIITNPDTEKQIIYSHVLIDVQELTAAAPIRQFAVTLDDSGQLCVRDGDRATLIRQIRPGYKKFAWLKFYIDNPNRTLSKQDLIKHFQNDSKYRYTDGDRISQYVYTAFDHKFTLMHLCFPELDDKAVRFTPTFTATTAMVS